MRKRLTVFVVSAALAAMALPATAANASCTDMGFGCIENRACKALNNKYLETHCIQ